MINEADSETLRRFYETISHLGIGLSSEDFVGYAQDYFREEYITCMLVKIHQMNGQGYKPLVNGDENPNFLQFIRRETFFRGLEEENGVPYSERGGLWTKEAQEERRTRVVRAFGNRVLNILMDGEYDNNGNRKSVRVNLCSYMEN